MDNIHFEFKDRDIKYMIVSGMIDKIEAAYKDNGDKWTDDFEKRLIDTIFEGLNEWGKVKENRPKPQ